MAKKQELTPAKKVPVLDLGDAIKNGIIGKSGTKYTYCSELSVDRYEQQEILAEYLQFGYGPSEVDKKLREIYNLFNGAKFADGSVKLAGMMNAKDLMHRRARTCQKIVFLYFNREDEDPTMVNEKLIDEKINDTTHYSFYSFFILATHFVRLRHKKLEESLEVSQKSVAEMMEKERK